MKSIIFDLDGTLVDSSESVLVTLKKTFKVHGVPIISSCDSSIVGPPLNEMLSIMSGTSDIKVLSKLSGEFKRLYDTVGYKSVTPFSGIDTMLTRLKQTNLDLYIATNKRKIPTLKIIKMLGWEKYFNGIYSLDSFNIPLESKGELLCKILSSNGLSGLDALYVGDKFEDGEAANYAKILFLMVQWGYEDTSGQKVSAIVSPGELFEYFS
jgi:phosphoglycolate phosphatase